MEPFSIWNRRFYFTTIDYERLFNDRRLFLRCRFHWRNKTPQVLKHCSCRSTLFSMIFTTAEPEIKFVAAPATTLLSLVQSRDTKPRRAGGASNLFKRSSRAVTGMFAWFLHPLRLSEKVGMCNRHLAQETGLKCFITCCWWSNKDWVNTKLSCSNKLATLVGWYISNQYWIDTVLRSVRKIFLYHVRKPSLRTSVGRLVALGI